MAVAVQDQRQWCTVSVGGSAGHVGNHLLQVSFSRSSDHLADDWLQFGGTILKALAGRLLDLCTRVPIQTLIDLLETGEGIDDFSKSLSLYSAQASAGFP